MFDAEPVNVPRERIEAFLSAWVSRSGNGDIIYGMGMEDDVLELTVSDLRSLLAAAPKAEPDDMAGYARLFYGGKACIGAEEAVRQIVRLQAELAALRAQTEAPKVEQEPVGVMPWEQDLIDAQNDPEWRAKWACYRGDTHPAPASDELLEALETIQEVCEFVNDCGLPHDGWKSKRLEKSWDAVRNFLAKHKGPQS